VRTRIEGGFLRPAVLAVRCLAGVVAHSVLQQSQ
jgi:hypothetical protein